MPCRSGTFWKNQLSYSAKTSQSFLRVLNKIYFIERRCKILRFYNNYNTKHIMNKEHLWVSNDRRKRKYLIKKLHQCHLSLTNVKLRSGFEAEPLRSTFCDLPYEWQGGGMFRNYVTREIKIWCQWFVLAMKRNNMRYAHSNVCVCLCDIQHYVHQERM